MTGANQYKSITDQRHCKATCLKRAALGTSLRSSAIPRLDSFLPALLQNLSAWTFCQLEHTHFLVTLRLSGGNYAVHWLDISVQV